MPKILTKVKLNRYSELVKTSTQNVFANIASCINLQVSKCNIEKIDYFRHGLSYSVHVY